MHYWWTDQDDLFSYDSFAKQINGVRFYELIVAFTKKIKKEKLIKINSINCKIS